MGPGDTRPVQIGVVSFGVNNGTHALCEFGFGAYASVAAARPWLQAYLSGTATGTYTPPGHSSHTAARNGTSGGEADDQRSAIIAATASTVCLVLLGLISCFCVYRDLNRRHGGLTTKKVVPS